MPKYQEVQISSKKIMLHVEISEKQDRPIFAMATAFSNMIKTMPLDRNDKELTIKILEID